MWLMSREPQEMFLQGLIQVTAAFHHLQGNNPWGAALLLQAALGRLEGYPARFGGISVALLCDDIASLLGSELLPQPSEGLPQEPGWSIAY